MNKNNIQSGRKQQKPKSKLKYILITVIILVIGVIYIMTYYGKDKSMKKGTGNLLMDNQFKKEGELTFFKKDGKPIITIDIEIADNDEERAAGLMWRNQLQERQGMLFIFEVEHIASFWMKNTILPLDMIFVNNMNQIVTIHEYTTPFSEQTYQSTEPALIVIEVNAGFTDKYGIKQGDRISWKR